MRPPLNTASPAHPTARRFSVLRPRHVALLTLGVTGLCALFYNTADLPLAMLLDRLIDPSAVEFWSDITKIGDATPYVALCVLLYFGGRTLFLRAAPQKNALRYYEASRIGLLGLVSYAVSGALVHTLKPSIGRMRPKLLFNNDQYGFSPFSIGWDTSSFPSGHTQSIFVIATLLVIIFPRMKWLFLSVALSVGLSRMILKAHFLSDVLFGAYIATMSVLLVRAYLFPDVKALCQTPATARKNA